MIDNRFPHLTFNLENGTIWSKRYNKEVGNLNYKGYLRTSTTDNNGVLITAFNHRLIYMVGHQCNIPNGYDVHHIDGNKLNNSLENLEMVERFDHNSFHKKGVNSPIYGKHQTEEHKKKISDGNKNNPKLSKEVIQYTLDGKLVKVWDSTMEAERNGFDHRCISRCCKGKSSTHKGFKWKYKDEIEFQN